MPTYINNSKIAQTVLEGMISRNVQILETIESEYLLDTNLQRVSDTPYYNPVVAVDKLAGAGNVAVNMLKTRVIKVIAKADLDLYLNDQSNNPPMFIAAGEIVFLTNIRQIEKLYVSASAVIIQLRDQLLIKN